MDPQSAPNEARHVLPGRMLKLAPGGLFPLKLVLEHHDVPDGKIMLATRKNGPPSTEDALVALRAYQAHETVAVRLLTGRAQTGSVNLSRGFKGYVWADDTGEPVWRPEISEA